jgi:hypothetical protein
MDVSKPTPKPRHFTQLRTDFDLEEVRRLLTSGIDPEERALVFGYRFSGYKGSKPLIGSVGGQKFYLFKRQYWNGQLCPTFFGRFVPQNDGTEIEGYFDVRPQVKTYLTTVTVLGGIVTLPMFLMSLTDIFQGSHYMHGSIVLGLLALPGYLLGGFFTPRFGLWFSKDDEKFILEFLSRDLLATNKDASTGA